MFRSLVRTPGITEVGREISAYGAQFRDCDYIRGVRRRWMIMYFQRRSLIVGGNRFRYNLDVETVVTRND